MNEQTIILIFLVMALGITLWLYILKAIKQVNYKACKEKVKPQMGLAARKFGRRWGERSAAQISQHKVPA